MDKLNKTELTIDFTYELETNDTFLAQWIECSPMARETWVQSQFASYQ